MTDAQDIRFQRFLMKGRLRQIQMIVEVADVGNLHEASRRLAVSQPAVTKAIREAESLLGIEIFERHAKGMRVTATGQETVYFFRQIIGATQRCTEAISAQKARGSSIVRIGAVSAGLNGVLAAALPSFAEKYPDIQMKVREVDGRRIQTHMGESDLDILLCREPEFILEGWQFVPLVMDEHRLVCAASHPLARRKGLTKDDLAGSLWMCPPLGVPALAVFERLIAELEAPRICQIETRSSVVIRETVRRTGAIALAPLSIFHADVAAGTLVALDHDIKGPINPVGMLVRLQSGSEATARLARYLERESASTEAFWTV